MLWLDAFQGGWVGGEMKPTVLPCPKLLWYLSLIGRLIPHGGGLLVVQLFFTMNAGFPRGFLPAYIPYVLAHSCLLSISLSACLSMYLISLCITRTFHGLVLLFSICNNWSLRSAPCNCVSKENYAFKLRRLNAFLTHIIFMGWRPH